MRELVAVGPTSAELFIDGEVRQFTNLSPSTDHTIDTISFRTLAPIGAVRSVVVTMNDVHFGEVECGKISGVRPAEFFVGPGERPYPEVMNESVIADAAALSPSAVVVKGDLTSFGTIEEFETFRQFYEPAFPGRLTYVRGNHDSYPGLDFAAFEVQVVDVVGLRIILLDTSRAHEPSGFISSEQADAARELALAVDETVIVMGHHPLFVPGSDDVRHFDGVRSEDSRRLLEALAPCPNVVAYTAGHTHRSRCRDIDGVAIVEVACVKDFPGAYAEYQVGTTGIAQIVHRATSPAAVAWAEKTRHMFDGYYGTYALGELTDRCFTLPLRRDAR